MNVHKFLKGGGKLEPQTVRQVLETLQKAGEPLSSDSIKAATGISSRKLAKILGRLQEIEAVEHQRSGDFSAKVNGQAVDETAIKAVSEQQRRSEYDQERLRKVQEYAEKITCRREYLLRYFGEEDVPLRCDSCDVCDRAIT
jgi:hypothetical protein